jgi:hypothetical protein
MISTAKLLRKRARLVQLLAQIESAQLLAEMNDDREMPSSAFTIEALEKIDAELLDRDIDPYTVID